MTKEALIEVDGTVLELLPDTRFRVRLDNEHEILFDAAEQVETWLNDQVAPEGYSFGWSDGEFMLWSDASWQDADVY